MLRIIKHRLLFVFCLLLLSAISARSQEFRWFDGFFFEGTAQYYFAPDILSEIIDTKVGFRGAIGYEFHRFRFGVEAGHTKITGTNPLVTELPFTPLVFKFGYALPIVSMFGLQADIGYGCLFSNVTHYETAIDMVFEKKKESSGRSSFASARLYVTLSPWKFIKFYAGGGADFIFENEWTIPLPVIEAGVSFKPFTFIRRKGSQESFPEPEPEDIIFESRSENIIIAETEQGKSVHLLNAVYFRADSAVLIENYRPILNEAGERLRENPELRITLIGYAAPFGLEAVLIRLSSARAHYCAEYLSSQYGIDESRISIEYHGAQKAPEFRGAAWESYRCVELIIQ
ncbi:MAG: OmpA family protein [Treponema sp.]|nr:OmpA family protein [Treponema sp.]